MSKFSNKLILTDLDGTFFDSKWDIVPRNLEAIEYFKENGGLFAIASGREPIIMGRLDPIIDDLVNCPCILCNGAYSYDFHTKQYIGEIELNYEKAAELIRAVRREFPETGIRLSTHDGFYVAYADRFIKRDILGGFRYLVDAGLYHECGIDETPHNGWTRCAFSAEPVVLAKLRERFEGEYGKYFAFNLASPEICDWQDIRATKGLALDALRKFLIESGRADESLQIYAIGDYENDLDMLAHCDVPTCPANAIESVKRISKIELCHCDGGTSADLIERIDRGEA